MIGPAAPSATVDPLPLVVGAAGLGAATLLLGRALDRGRHADAVITRWRPAIAAPSTTGATPPPSSWIFPVPSLGARVPEIADGWGSPRHDADGTRRLHLGADIMFRRRTRADLVDAYPPGTPHGTAGYFMPDDVPALAAGVGVVSYARTTARGGTVTVRHPEGWTTYYTHLSALSVSVGQLVAAGQPVGVIGGDPLDRRRLMHLHFELWRDHTRRGVTDPAPYLRAMKRRTVEHPAALRNRRAAALTYRPIGAVADRYPAWVQALRGRSGVYVIRERDADGDPIVVYVGESHTGRLYETLTRHFQSWRRFKGYWRGQYAEGHDPGMTYPRDRVEVAVRVMSGPDAIDEERRLIRRLNPRDNLRGQPDADDVPF